MRRSWCPGYGAQGASAADAVRAARADGTGVVVNASRSLMYAYLKRPGFGAGTGGGRGGRVDEGGTQRRPECARRLAYVARRYFSGKSGSEKYG